MITEYPYPLKVCNTEGKRITANIFQLGNGQNILKIPFIDRVKKDNPSFSKKGIISISYAQKDHAIVITNLTSYLENLFLKELSDADSDNTSNKRKSNSGGDSQKPPRRSKAKSKRKDSSQLHDSRRGDE